VNILETALPGVLIIEPVVYRDGRGFFVETFHAERYGAIPGLDKPFVQDNQSRSVRRVLRGIHAQGTRPQGKLARVSYGSVFDVAVDIDPASPHFGTWVGIELSAENQRQLWIPPGYGHAFLVLSEFADFHYKCTDFYVPNDEIGVVWNDPTLGIDWPIDDPIVSEKDAQLPQLTKLRKAGVQ